MATLWVIHTLLMIIFYRELYPKTAVDGNQTNDKGAADDTLPDSTKSPPPRDRAPSRFVSYIYNGMS